MERRFRIASPCSADWARMAGNERVRYCPECKLHVYNFSELTGAEIEEIVASTEGRLCARLYERRDGTILTENCPVGLRPAVRRVSRILGAALTAMMSMGPSVTASPRFNGMSPLVQIQSNALALALEVVDRTGAVVPHAAVTILNETTGNKIWEQTDAKGQLKIADLPAGNYTITIRVPGFQVLERTHLGVPSQKMIRLQLEVATTMGVVVEVTQNVSTESCPVSSHLVETPSAKSEHGESPSHRPSLFRRFVSGLRRVF